VAGQSSASSNNYRQQIMRSRCFEEENDNKDEGSSAATGTKVQLQKRELNRYVTSRGDVPIIL
jgi:hypothetical protein